MSRLQTRAMHLFQLLSLGTVLSASGRVKLRQLLGSLCGSQPLFSPTKVTRCSHHLGTLAHALLLPTHTPPSPHLWFRMRWIIIHSGLMP